MVSGLRSTLFAVPLFLFVTAVFSGCGQPSPEAPPAPPAAEPFSLLAPLEKPEVSGPLGPASVVDSGPHGLVEGEPAVRVRFSRAMHSIGDVGTAGNVKGVRLEPSVAGQWRWESPTLLRFYPESGFPVGQRFRVELDQAELGTTGVELDSSYEMEFETRPRLNSIQWTSDQDLGHFAVLRFNAEVSPAAVEEFVELQKADFQAPPTPDRVVPAEWASRGTGGSVDVSDEEAENNDEAEDNEGVEEELYGPWDQLSHSVQRWGGESVWGCEEDARCLAVIPEKPLYRGVRLKVTVEPGYTSAEGPLPSTVGDSSQTELPEPFRLVAAYCSDDPCRPDSYIDLQFNRSLASEQEQETLVTWSGKKGSTSAWGSWNSINIYPQFEPESRQWIELKRGIRSSAGETLEAMRLRVDVGPERPAVTLSGHLTVVDRRSPHSLAAELHHVVDYRASMGALPVDFWIPALEAMKNRKPLPSEVSERLARASLKKRRFNAGYSEALLPLYEAVPPKTSGAVIYETSHAEDDSSVRGLAVFTRLGLSIIADHRQVTVRVTDLASAKPFQGVSVELYRDDNTRITAARSDGRGIASLSASGESGHSHYVIARFEDDVAILPLDERRVPSDPSLAFTLIPDRRAYLPGDKVYVTGHARTMDEGLTLSGKKLTEEVAVSIVDGSKGIDVREIVSVDEYGNFMAALQLPERSGLGWVNVRVTSPKDGVNGSGATRIRVAEFRTPEFEVAVSPRPEPVNGPEKTRVPEQGIRGRQLSARVAGDLLNGSPMSDAEYEVSVRSSGGRWSIKGWPRTRFGNLRAARYTYEQPPGDSGNLDAGGRAVWKAIPQPGVEGPTIWDVEAVVTDTTRQTVASSAEILVHPGEFYLGIRYPKSRLYDYVVGDEVEVEVLAVHPDGSAFTRPERIRDIAVEIYEPPASEQQESGDTDPGSEDESQKVKVPAVPEPVIRCLPEEASEPPVVATCKVALDRIGTWRMAARATDGLGNTLSTRTWLGVHQESEERSGTVRSSKQWGLVPDKDSYAPGDTALLDLVLRGKPVGGLFAYGELGMRDWKAFEMVDGLLQQPFEVPISEHEAPQFGGASVAYEERSKWELNEGRDWGRPGAHVDSFSSDVPRSHMRLDVTVTPLSEEASPGENVEVRVTVKDSEGAGRQSQVTLWAVDEGVLLIEPHKIPDPLTTMHPMIWSVISASDSRQLLAFRLGLSPKDANFGIGGMGMGGSGRGGGGAGMARMKAGAAMVTPRGNFITTPYFEALETDENGQVTATISLPDNLTRFKLFAVASADTTRFGKGESSIEVNKPVMLRPTMPRFAAKGDQLDAGVVVQNATDKELEATVDVSLSGALESTGSTSQSIKVAAGRSAELTYPMRAMKTGSATATFRMRAGEHTDAVEITLPVKERIVTETTATYGILEDAALAIPLVWPEPLRRNVGGLSMSLSSSRLTGLKDAAEYLIQYPHGCLEQTSSRLMPLALLGRIDPALTGVQADELNEKMEVGIGRLREMQRTDGAFNYWPSGSIHRYASMWATLALLDVEANGLDAGGMLDDAMKWVEEDVFVAPEEKSGSETLLHVAFAGYLLAEANRLPESSEEVLTPALERYQELPLYGRLWLARALHEAGGSSESVDTLIQSVMNEARETARAIHLVEPPRAELWRWFSSSGRTDAIALDVLLAVRPDHPAVEKLAKGLLDARTRGRWRNTQENAWVLRAMIGYLERFEADEPAFSAGIWLGDELLAQRDFVGRSASVEEVNVPIAKVMDESGPIVMSREGQGRLYYRIAATVARENQDLDALDRGFALERIYELEGEALSEGDVIPAGSTVLVRLRFKTSDPRYFVALTDRLPAGLEGLDPQDKIRARHGTRIFRGPFHHNEFRADRVSFYADRMGPGEHEVVYRARATTRGTFSAAPATIEEMYAPEVSGRTYRIEVSVE